MFIRKNKVLKEEARKAGKTRVFAFRLPEQTFSKVIKKQWGMSNNDFTISLAVTPSKIFSLHNPTTAKIWSVQNLKIFWRILKSELRSILMTQHERW